MVFEILKMHFAPTTKFANQIVKVEPKGEHNLWHAINNFDFLDYFVTLATRLQLCNFLGYRFSGSKVTTT
jgi:hypothetical protein